MAALLAIESSLEHDGDGIVGYSVHLENPDFSANTSLWGTPHDHVKLAKALTGFPTSSSAKLTYCFGASGVGLMNLEFFCLDNLGHVGVWGSIESKHPALPQGRHEQASVFIRCDPASIDRFAAALRCFSVGAQNRAELPGLEP